MGWIGDPIWLEEVLRPALGERLRVLDGWRERGHGDFRDIRGVMWHHTGNSRETAKSIARGRPDLPGPLANLHIAHSGVVTIVAVGVCWHAGRGSYPWLPTDNANWHMIGVECAWPTIRRDGSYDAGERWPDAQIVSMRDVAAALTLKLGYGPERNIGHKEYAGAAQGKWDPGNLSMDWFRAEVAKDTRGEFDHPLTPPPAVIARPPILPKPRNPRDDRILLEEVWDQLRGIEGRGWPVLGDKTIVDYLAELGNKVDALAAKLDAREGLDPVTLGSCSSRRRGADGPAATMSTGLARLAGLAGCTFRAELAEVAVAATARRPNARGAGHTGLTTAPAITPATGGTAQPGATGDAEQAARAARAADGARCSPAAARPRRARPPAPPAPPAPPSGIKKGGEPAVATGPRGAPDQPTGAAVSAGAPLRLGWTRRHRRPRRCQTIRQLLRYRPSGRSRPALIPRYRRCRTRARRPRRLVRSPVYRWRRCRSGGGRARF